MKISKIEYENFRNFKDHGEIKCSTDGKVTIIYGKNGDGKTTLHQLFQWVFYGQVHFNKTTTDRLYNLQFESEQSFGSTFEVMGRIDFEHNGINYSLTRRYTYKKDVNDSKKIAEDLVLHRMDSDNNWKLVDHPMDVIEKILPSGLSDYFFFDGESMIADLRVKGRDSAFKLRKALYSIFDLDVLESAITHIGRTDLKTTVLGKLYLSKGTISSGREISNCKANIDQAQDSRSKCEADIEMAKKEKAEKQAIIEKVSEEIGSNKSKSDYELQRKTQKNQRDIFLKNVERNQADFGDAIMDMFPQLLISKAVADAKTKIHLKIEQNKLPEGVNKKLVNYLLSGKTNACICGNPLCEKEVTHIKDYLAMLPPHSYTVLYNDFTKTAKNWGKGYDPNKIDTYVKDVLDNLEMAEKCDESIRDLDEAEKKSRDIEDLIVARGTAENDVIGLDDIITAKTTELRKLEIYIKNKMREFDELTKSNKEAQRVSRKINIMEQVSDFFVKKLNDDATEFSKKLEANIQQLINSMLTSKRSVSVSPEFSVTVTDSFNDESKSEGQFAVVSFAYIGGILKLLLSEENLSIKEYPLVLDGPFSKLDAIQRQNVVNSIPEFAPQVILFSKDDLQNIFGEEKIGRVWTIVSNEEKNIAYVEEGYKWN